jgi:hypothetical protein
MFRLLSPTVSLTVFGSHSISVSPRRLRLCPHFASSSCHTLSPISSPTVSPTLSRARSPTLFANLSPTLSPSLSSALSRALFPSLSLFVQTWSTALCPTLSPTLSPTPCLPPCRRLRSGNLLASNLESSLLFGYKAGLITLSSPTLSGTWPPKATHILVIPGPCFCKKT